MKDVSIVVMRMGDSHPERLSDLIRSLHAPDASTVLLAVPIYELERLRLDLPEPRPLAEIAAELADKISADLRYELPIEKILLQAASRDWIPHPRKIAPTRARAAPTGKIWQGVGRY